MRRPRGPLRDRRAPPSVASSARAAIAEAGPLLADLRGRAELLGVAGAIDFLGLRADIENVYRGGRVLVLTSRRERLSVAMMEAMASGLSAVVADVGAELLVEGRAA